MTMESQSMQNAVPTMPSLETAVAVWHRRKWLAFLVFVTVLSITAPVTLNQPNTYASTATVLVEHSLIPVDVFGISTDSELETRLRTISERILSRSRLYDLITRFNLYPELRQRSALETAVEQMRRDIQFQFNGVRQPTGLDATIAFSLSYRGRNPETVAQVTNALTALYVEESTKMGEQKITGTTQFLQAQLDDARQQMNAQEQRLNAFRERHMGELPEQQPANLAALEQLNAEVRATKIRKDDLTRQMTGVSGTAGDTLSARLVRLRQELTDLRMRDTDEHPDVVRVKHEIAGLERQLATRRSPAAASQTVSQPASPGAAGSELAPLSAEEQALQSRIAIYQQRVENAPLIEQALQQLSQDYAAARDHYQSLQQRYEGAQLAESMDRRMHGEQFRILDPAVPAQHPVGPRRSQLLLVAMLLSLGAGVGAAFLAEAVDTSFHTVEDVRAFTTVPVLGSIPPIVTETDARRRRRQFRLVTLGMALGVAVLASSSSFLTTHSVGSLVHSLMSPHRF